MHDMTPNQHSILGVHATTTNTISPNDLIDALDNLANAATSKSSLINTHAITIKSQQLTIEELTTANAKLHTSIESPSKNQQHQNKYIGLLSNVMDTVGPIATA